MQFHGDSYKYIKPHPFRAVWFILHMASGSVLNLMQYKPHSPQGCGLTYIYVYIYIYIYIP